MERRGNLQYIIVLMLGKYNYKKGESNYLVSFSGQNQKYYFYLKRVIFIICIILGLFRWLGSDSFGDTLSVVSNSVD